MSNIVPNALPDLARRINAAHADCEKAVREGLGHALECGRLLIEAKAKVPHGQWLPWLQQHTAVSERTAQAYMRVARNAPALESKAQHVADLPFREALKLLASDAGKAPADDEERLSYVPLRELTLEARRHLVYHWPDQLHKYTVLLDAAGLSPAEIADTLGTDLADVEAVLDPRPPERFRGPGDRPELQRWYRSGVEAQLARWQETACERAARCAAHEGYPHVADALLSQQEFHRRRAARLESGRDEFYTTGAEGTALWCCVTSDARIAIGIDKAEGNYADLLRMFAMFRGIAEAQAVELENQSTK